MVGYLGCRQAGDSGYRRFTQGLGQLHKTKATGPDHLTDNLGTSARSLATTGCHGNFMPLVAAEMFSG